MSFCLRINHRFFQLPFRLQINHRFPLPWLLYYPYYPVRA